MRSLLLAAAACAALPAIAARPLTTEDASVLEKNACQLEAWIDRTRDATQGWLVPACNFGANIEWQVGFSRRHADGEARFAEAYAQAKTAVRLGESPWSIGAVAGVVRRPLNERARGWQNPYVLVPVSVGSEDLMLHANAGWSRDREAARDTTPWGIALEGRVNPRTWLLGEVYGENRERPFVRGGFRWTAIADRLDLDLSFVTRAGGERADRLVSIGFLYQTGRLMR